MPLVSVALSSSPPASSLLVVTSVECGIKVSLWCVIFVLYRGIRLRTALTKVSVAFVGPLDILPVIVRMHGVQVLLLRLTHNLGVPMMITILHQSKMLWAKLLLLLSLELLKTPHLLLLLVPLGRTPGPFGIFRGF